MKISENTITLLLQSLGGTLGQLEGVQTCMSIEWLSSYEPRASPEWPQRVDLCRSLFVTGRPFSVTDQARFFARSCYWTRCRLARSPEFLLRHDRQNSDQSRAN